MNLSRLPLASLPIVLATLCAGPPAAHAAVVPIEQAAEDVRGYMICVQDAYNNDQWRSNTIDQCRGRFPAVQALHQGSYVSVTFNREQTRLYLQARQRWVDFDKALKAQLHSQGLAEQFAAANVATAYSFDQLAKSLDARFAELQTAPFIWYPAKRAPYRTAQGLDLQQLHQAELQRFIECLTGTVDGSASTTLTRADFDQQVDRCLKAISGLNLDRSRAVYKPQAFQSIAEQGWGQIAQTQAAAQEQERQRLAKEYAESWPQVIKGLLGKLLVALLVIGGIYGLWLRLINGEPSSADTRSARSTKSGGSRRAPQRDYDTPAAKPVDLSTFTLKHRKISRLTTPHRCASCVHWQGQRTPHPVTREWYVKVDTKGPCGHKHPGSPYGIKRDMDGFHCKDFTDCGFG